MSFDALAWAAKQNTGSSATKLVLLGLAECASRPDALAFPSKAALIEFSSLDRKTVIKALDQLEEGGFITDTGKRMGRTQQVKVYHLELPVVAEESQKRDPLKESQFSQQRVPKTGPGISKGISTSRAKSSFGVAREIHDLTDGFRTDCIAWAVAEMGWGSAQADQEWLRFADSAKANGRKYKDWPAAWRNWCRSPYCKTKPAEELTAYRKEPLRV